MRGNKNYFSDMLENCTMEMREMLLTSWYVNSNLEPVIFRFHWKACK